MIEEDLACVESFLGSLIFNTRSNQQIMKWKFSVYIFIVLILSFLAVGEIKEIGQDIKYPARAGINLTNFEGTVSKEKIFEQIEKIARNENMTIFKPIWQENGQEKVYVFGIDKLGLGRKKYVKDQKFLMDEPVTGMYYLSEKLNTRLERSLTNLGFQCKGGNIPWQLTIFDFFFGNIRSLSIWTLFVVFAILLFAVKMLYVKKAMVQRSLGIFARKMVLEICSDLLCLTISGIVSIGIINLTQNGISGVFAVTFSLLMLFLGLALLLVTLITNALFALNIQLMKVSQVLKNKSGQSFVLWIWLFGIVLSLFIFGVTVNGSLLGIRTLSAQSKVMRHWKVASDFVTLTFSDSMQEHINANTQQIDSAYMQENALKNSQFLQSFKADEVLYSLQSKLDKTMLSPEFLNRIEGELNLDLASKIRYVNQEVIRRNKKLYPRNHYGNQEQSAITIYIPEKYQKDIEAIQKIIGFEWLQYTTFDENFMSITKVPNGQKTFLFNQTDTPTELIPQQEKTDEILVSLDFKQLFQDKTFLLQADQIVLSAFFKQDKVKQKLVSSELSKNFSSMTLVSKNMLEKRARLLSQLQGTVMALVALMLAQLFVLYQYVVTLIQKNVRQISVRSLLGGKVLPFLIRIFSPFFIGTALITCLGYRQFHHLSLFLSLSAFYSVEFILIASIVLIKMKKKRVQIMKGDFEII